MEEISEQKLNNNSELCQGTPDKDFAMPSDQNTKQNQTQEFESNQSAEDFAQELDDEKEDESKKAELMAEYESMKDDFKDIDENYADMYEETKEEFKDLDTNYAENYEQTKNYEELDANYADNYEEANSYENLDENYADIYDTAEKSTEELNEQPAEEFGESVEQTEEVATEEQTETFGEEPAEETVEEPTEDFGENIEPAKEQAEVLESTGEQPAQTEQPVEESAENAKQSAETVEQMPETETQSQNAENVEVQENANQPQKEEPKLSSRRRKIKVDTNVTSIDLENVQKIVEKKYNIAKDNKLYKLLLDAVYAGKNSLSQNAFIQTMTIDNSWIDAIDGTLEALENICSHPKISIFDQRELVKLERAKRVDEVAVRHLSTHTQFIKMIRPDGSVLPSEVMTRTFEEDYTTYENRFVYTLLQRVNLFVDQRYRVIMERIDAKNDTYLTYKSNFKFGAADVGYDLHLSVKTPTQSEMSETGKLIKKLNYLNKRLKALNNSVFANKLKGSKPILPPIQRTNLLVKNPDYLQCYNLWLMISSYDAVGYSINVIEKPLPFDDDYFNNLTKLVAASTEVMLANDQLRRDVYKRTLAKKIIKKQYKIERIKFNIGKYKLEKQSVLYGDINEFYRKHLKKFVQDLDDYIDDPETVEKRLNFSSVIRQVESLNMSMYRDIMQPEKDYNKEYETQSAKLLDDLNTQKDINKNYETLIKVKEQELSKIKLQAQKQVEKEKKLAELYKAKVKQENQRKLEEAQREQRREEKKKLLLEKARLLEEENKRKEQEQKSKKGKKFKDQQKLAQKAQANNEAKLQKLAWQQQKEEQKLAQAKAKEKERIKKQLEKEKAMRKAELERERAREKAELERIKKEEALQRAEQRKQLAAEKAEQRAEQKRLKEALKKAEQERKEQERRDKIAKKIVLPKVKQNKVEEDIKKPAQKVKLPKRAENRIKLPPKEEKVANDHKPAQKVKLPKVRHNIFARISDSIKKPAQKVELPKRAERPVQNDKK